MDGGDKAILKEVVRGQCPPHQLPTTRGRTVRVYLSSTPDMAVERGAVQRVVYPKLKQYCAGKYGIDFKFVELHWGVEESTGYLSSDLDIIEQEITYCQERSIGPAFLCLVGHKLGSALLPKELPEDHYHLIAQLMENYKDEGGCLMEKYYQREDHTEPAVYRLQRDQVRNVDRESAISRVGSDDDVTLFKKHFRSCVFEATKDGLLLGEHKIAYTPTAFEKEVEAGLKKAGDKVKSTTMCLIRTIRDLDRHHDDTQYGRYCDLIDGIEDDESQERILSIRELEVRSSVPGSNLKQVTSDWESVSFTVDRNSEEFRVAKYAQKMRQGSPLRLAKHQDYLEEICTKVQSQLKQLIDRAAAPLAMERQSVIDKVYAEVIEHWRTVDTLNRGEIMEEALSNVLKYLKDKSSFTCTIHGSDPALRSRLFSKAAIASQAAEPDGAKPFTVVRSIQTFQSHNKTLKYLILSLCRQISFLYEKNWKETTSLDQLKKDLEVCLQEYPTASVPLFIHLDGVELLDVPPEELDFSWIPDNLPQNVKLVVSCSSSAKEMLSSLSTKTPYEAQIINLDGDSESESEDEGSVDEEICFESGSEEENNMGPDEQTMCIPTIPSSTEQIFMPSIGDKESALSPISEQDSISENNIDGEQGNLGTLPPEVNQPDGLMTKSNTHLIEVLRNTLESAGLQPDATSNDDVIINLWLKQLSRRHGKHAVSSVFRYLSLAKKGLTESELLDLLSLDEELLNEGVFLGTQPLLRRYPELLWARLKDDLGPVLHIRDLDNRDVISWAIPGINDLTDSHFISAISPASKTHHQIALYFMGIAASPKPMDDCQSMASSLTSSLTEPEIRVDTQPSIFEIADSTYSAVNYNKRRLSELPHHLLHAGQIEELKKHVVFSYKWLYNKMNATSATEMISIISQLACSAELKDDKEVEKLVKALEDSFLYIQESPSCLRTELTGRLLPSIGKPFFITSLVKQCDDEGYRHCQVSPLSTNFDDGEDEVQQIIPCDTGYYEELYMTPVPGKNQVITYTVPEKLCLWNIDAVEQALHYECNQYAYCTDLRVSQNGLNILALNNGNPRQSFLEDSPILDIYDIESGKKLHRIYFEESDKKPKRLFRVIGLNERKIMFDTPNYVAVCIDIVRICSIKTGEELSKIPWPFLITPDERYLVMTEHDGHRLVLRTFPEVSKVAKLTSPKNITAMVPIMTETSLHILVAAGSAGVLSRYDLENIESESLEPIKQGVLVEKKDSSMKGGCGKLIMSKDNAFVLAVYIYALGKDIHRTNFIMSTETLENAYIYESGVKDLVQFSPDNQFLVHLKSKQGVFDIIEISSGDLITTYQTQSHIRQVCFGTSEENVLLVATKEELQTIDLEKLVQKGRKELAEIDSDSDSVSVEYNTPRIRMRTLNADVPLAALMSTKAVDVIPVKLTQINEDTGEVKTTTMNLLQKVHFADTELPSYLTEVKVTPDGKKFVLTFEQLHIMGSNKKGDRKVLSGPLKDDFMHTKVTGGMAGMGVSRDVFGVGTNSLSQGTPLQKGSKIYGNNDTRRGTIFEAEGGESIQRVPSVIRVYDAETGDCVQGIQVRNEKLLACTDNHLVTSTGDGEFANVYSITSGQLTSTIDCGPASAVFTIDDNCLIIVPRKNSSILHIYTGSSYLDLKKCDLSDGDLVIWEVMTCSRVPTSILVSLLGERAGQQGSGSINYSWVDVTFASVTNTFSCHSELVQISPDGTIGVDSEFRFYDLKKGKVLFQIQMNDMNLTEYASFIDDEGNLMVFLDNENGKINIVDIHKKKLISQSFFHPQRSKVESLRGHREVAAVVPLHGGLQMVIIDGRSVKHFLLQTPKRQIVALGMVKIRKSAFESPKARTEYYHTVNSDGDVPLTRKTSNRAMHRTSGSRLLYNLGKRK